MGKLIGDRYALSIFSVGLEMGKVEEFYGQLKGIDSLFKKEDKLFQIFIHPRITKDEKKSIIDEIFINRIAKQINNFFYILIDKRREKFLFEIIEEFKKYYDSHNRIVDVVATTALPMEDRQIRKLELVLENKLNKKVRISNEVDKSIIGGVSLNIDNKLMDNTLMSQLKSMADLINMRS